MDKRKKSLRIKKDIREIKGSVTKKEMEKENEIIVTYNGKEYSFNGAESVLDRFSNIIEKDYNILAIRYGNSIKSLKHRPQKSAELKFLDMTSEDGKMIYIRGLLYILCMAINRLYPNAKIRTEYQLHNAMYVNITNIELTEDMIKDIELEMKNIVNKDYEITKKSFTKEESEEFYSKNRSLRGMLQKDVKNEVKLYFCDRIFQLFLWCNAIINRKA